MTMQIRRFFSRVFRDPDPGVDGTGGDTVTIDTPVIDAPDASAPAADASQPKSMLEAISSAIESPDAKKTDLVKPAPVDPAKPEPAKPEIKPEPAKPEDLTKIPEGLSKPAQERFQKLANANKELTEQHRQVLDTVEPFRKTLQENAIQKEQFDQAASVIGMMNRGDFDGALKVLDEQRRLLALAMGKSVPGVDTLSDFPDLRQRVDQMQITEEDALEIARNRSNDAARRTNEQRQTEQRQQQTQQRESQQAEQKAWDDGLQAVDAFCTDMKKSDLDFAAIESKLLPRIPALIEGVPPAQWASKVKALYEIIKETAGGTKTASSTNTLRPTGQASPNHAPKSMHEAMWGSK